MNLTDLIAYLKSKLPRFSILQNIKQRKEIQILMATLVEIQTF